MFLFCLNLQIHRIMWYVWYISVYTSVLCATMALFKMRRVIHLGVIILVSSDQNIWGFFSREYF